MLYISTSALYKVKICFFLVFHMKNVKEEEQYSFTTRFKTCGTNSWVLLKGFKKRSFSKSLKTVQKGVKKMLKKTKGVVPQVLETGCKAVLFGNKTLCQCLGGSKKTVFCQNFLRFLLFLLFLCFLFFDQKNEKGIAVCSTQTLVKISNSQALCQFT